MIGSWRKRKLAPSTTTRYRQSLRRQIEPHRIGRRRLRQVQRSHVEDWIDELIVQKHQRHDDRTLDPYSIRKAFALLRQISAEGWNAGDLVFCSEIGTPLSPKTICDQFDTLLRKAELPDVRFHDLRHT